MSDRWNEVEETSGKTGLHFERVGNRTESLLPKGERSMTYEDYDNLDDRADRIRAYAQDCLDAGHVERNSGALGNIMSIRDEADAIRDILAEWKRRA